MSFCNYQTQKTYTTHVSYSIDRSCLRILIKETKRMNHIFFAIIDFLSFLYSFINILYFVLLDDGIQMFYQKHLLPKMFFPLTISKVLHTFHFLHIHLPD